MLCVESALSPACEGLQCRRFCYVPGVNPSLSIVIPTHHRAALLPQVLRPLLTDPGVGEIVVVSHGWDGPTLELLERNARLDGRLKWSVLEPNQGLVRAKLHGTEQAAGSLSST